MRSSGILSQIVLPQGNRRPVFRAEIFGQFHVRSCHENDFHAGLERGRDGDGLGSADDHTAGNRAVGQFRQAVRRIFFELQVAGHHAAGSPCLRQNQNPVGSVFDRRAGAQLDLGQFAVSGPANLRLGTASADFSFAIDEERSELNVGGSGCAGVKLNHGEAGFLRV